MKIQLHEVKVREIYDGYKDSGVNGVVGYGGKLDIRPKFQREFVYKEKERNAVLETVLKEFPLNIMYWIDNGDDTYEMLDGQQRTISICSFINNDFSILINGSPQYFHSLGETLQNRILEYPLMIYFCTGTEEEQLEWFKVINIAGLELKPQELRNAIYTGPWLTSAKTWFSKRDCAAYRESSDYVNAELDRQGYLELALKWFTNDRIEEYMAKHRNDVNANELWSYYSAVFTWVKMIFPKKRRQMKGLPWGEYYNLYHDKKFDAATLEIEIQKLMKDVDVEKKSGIYAYLLSGKEKYLNIRAFDDDMKAWAYETQNGICNKCGEHFELNEMEGDHIIPWHTGGKTKAENCQMLCIDCNRRKSGS